MLPPIEAIMPVAKVSAAFRLIALEEKSFFKRVQRA